MTLANLVNDRTAVVAIKDILQANLLDPRAQYTSDNRNWIHTDEPLNSATYPRIQIRKRGPSNVGISSIGREFIEQRELILDIQMWLKAPFKWQVSGDTYLQNEELIKEWQDKIWNTLKDEQLDMHNTYGITGLKNLGERDPYLEPDSQLYTGVISVRIWYFRT